MISIHALLAESDHRVGEFQGVHFEFLSTLSLRRATGGSGAGSWRLVTFLSTLSLRRATRYGRPIDVQLVFLSTLSLRRATESIGTLRTVSVKFLSTLSLRRATVMNNIIFVPGEFLSTLSLRRATARLASRQQPAGISIHALLAESDGIGLVFLWWGVHFYPRSPCGERLKNALSNVIDRSISIHALLAESDLRCFNASQSRFAFLSTLSLRRATRAF